MAQAHVGEAINEQKHRPNRESARPHGHEQIMTRQRGLRWWCRLRRNGGTKGRPRRCQCADDAETRGAGRPCQMSHVPKQIILYAKSGLGAVNARMMLKRGELV